MRINLKRLLTSIVLIGLAIAIPACNLPFPAQDKNVGATQTFSILYTQIANNTPTLTPTPIIAATPTATLDPVNQALTSQAATFQYSLVVSPTPTLAGARPTVYILQAGEYPWCIARRLNIHPKDLLDANNLSSGWIYAVGLSLTIPQTPRPFPPPRAFHPHPTNYTVPQSNMTVNAVACYFGDVEPLAITQANALTSPILTIGTILKIP